MLALQGVRAHLVFPNDATINAKAAVSAELTRLGAKVCKRLTKEVTHIIFQRSQRNLHDKLAQEQAVKDTYDAALSHVSKWKHSAK